MTIKVCLPSEDEIRLLVRQINADGFAEPEELQGIFGVPLQTSVRYANVAISLTDHNGQSYIYGYVPIVVAKCGVFLKEKGNEFFFFPIRKFHSELIRF